MELEKLQIEIRDLRKEVSTLTQMISELSIIIKSTSNKTNNHIDFVEGVYTSVRHPLDYIKKRIEYVTGQNQTSLPEIEYNQNGINIGITPQNPDQK